MLQDYLDTIESPMLRARIKAALAKGLNINGTFRTREDYIVESVKAGGRVVVDKEGRALSFSDGRYMREKDISKAALDFAEWLCKRTLLSSDYCNYASVRGMDGSVSRIED